jgi:hypothetical protein
MSSKLGIGKAAGMERYGVLVLLADLGSFANRSGKTRPTAELRCKRGGRKISETCKDTIEI